MDKEESSGSCRSATRVGAAGRRSTHRNLLVRFKDFSTASTQTRCASVLILEAGLRPESIGNYEGTDGLTIGDLPELEIEYDEKGDAKVSFLRVPTMIVVRRDLSKARHQYFTFLRALSSDDTSDYGSCAKEDGGLWYFGRLSQSRNT